MKSGYFKINNEIFLLSLSVCTFISLLIITISGLNLLSLLVVEIELKWKSLVILPLAFIFVLFFLKKLDLVENLFRLLIFAFIVVVFSVYAGTLFPDTSWDGTAYHSDAIICLVEGKSILASCPEVNNSSTIQAKNFPAAAWGFSSVLVSIFNILEASHAIGFIWLIIFSLLSLKIAIKFKMHFILIPVFLLIILSNPVLIYQLWTNYNDSLVYLVSMCNIYSYIFIIDKEKKIQQLGIILLFSTGIFLINLKFSSAVLFLFSFIIISIFIFTMTKLKIMSFMKVEKKFAVYLLLFSLFLGIGNSYHPYVTNLSQGEHLFHPIMGNERSSWIENINGDCLKYENRFMRAIKAPFAGFDQMGGPKCKEIIYSDLWSDKKSWNLKNKYKLFEVHYQKIANHDQGWRLAGFGPIFPLLVSLSLIIFVLNFLSNTFINRISIMKTSQIFSEKKLLFIFALITSILLQIGITEPTWIVRYTPLLWTLSVLPFIILPDSKLRALSILSLPIIVLLIIHSYLLIQTKWSWEKDGVNQIRQIENFQKNFLYNSVFSSNIFFDKFTKFKFGGQALNSSKNCFLTKFRYGSSDIMIEIDYKYLEKYKNTYKDHNLDKNLLKKRDC
tara:strand:+ start:16087 stop:17931 length:1845 start_codon:yes stop_codon:yes gene_type:complete